jgi:hypothetical protein
VFDEGFALTDIALGEEIMSAREATVITAADDTPLLEWKKAWSP